MAPEKYEEKNTHPEECKIELTRKELRLFIAAALMEIECDRISDDQLAYAAAAIEKRLEEAFWGEEPFDEKLLAELKRSYLDNE